MTSYFAQVPVRTSINISSRGAIKTRGADIRVCACVSMKFGRGLLSACMRNLYIYARRWCEFGRGEVVVKAYFPNVGNRQLMTPCNTPLWVRVLSYASRGYLFMVILPVYYSSTFIL